MISTPSDIEQQPNELITDWPTRTARHHQMLSPLVEPYIKIRAQGKRQPVLDFLFEYYSFRANHLLKWNPGIRTTLPPEWQPSDKRYVSSASGWTQDPRDFPDKRKASLDWLIALQQGILSRPSAFGCYGLHEWAMVYRSEQVRHEQVPLRLSPAEIAEFVDSQQIICSHYDAFRFFTDQAKPLNRLQPESDLRNTLEQGGCIHANMDLYKWVYKFYPWLDSDLLADTFLLAYETRTLDMMASPYDLTDYDLPAIPIETTDGRQEYIRRQKEIAARANDLRVRLLDSLIELRAWINRRCDENSDYPL